jgi:hypothetical protein
VVVGAKRVVEVEVEVEVEVQAEGVEAAVSLTVSLLMNKVSMDANTILNQDADWEGKGTASHLRPF